MNVARTLGGEESNPFEPLLPGSGTTAATLGAGALYSPPAFGVLVAANAVSILCSAVCITLALCLWRRQVPRRGWHSQPVSIRLTLYASIIDIFYTLFRVYDMVIAQRDMRTDSQANCKAAMFGLTFFALLSVFIRALFSVHLHAVIVHRANRPLRYENMFIVLSLALALLLALLPLTRFAYAWVDYDPTLGSGHCSYFSLETIPHGYGGMETFVDEARQAVIAGVLWCWATYFAWVALTSGYCMLVIAAVICHLWKEHGRTTRLTAQQILGTAVADGTAADASSWKYGHTAEAGPMVAIIRSDDGVEVWRMANKVLLRVAQFPATIVICHSLEIAWATATLTRILPLLRNGVGDGPSDLKQLYMGMQAMLALQGVITLLSLCLEPAVKAMVARECCWRRHISTGTHRVQTSGASKRSSTGEHGVLAALDSQAYGKDAMASMPWDVVDCEPSAVEYYHRRRIF